MVPFKPFQRRKDSAERRRLGALLKKADAARDEGRWKEAADGFRLFLTERPEAAGIHVQLGHMLKELGQFEDALVSYRHALELEPENTDTLLMTGHLYKRWGKYDEAVACYQDTLLADKDQSSHSDDAFRELSALGAYPARFLAQAQSRAGASGSRPGDRVVRPAQILLDLSDVFKFLRDHATVSGIQRVQLAMTEKLLRAGRTDLRVSYLDESSRAYYTVDAGLVLSLCDILSSHDSDHGRMKDLLHSLEASSRPYVPQAGDTVFVAGAFWMLPDAHGIYATLKKAGVHIGIYIYDVIPVTHPEFCASELVARFTRCLYHFLALADFIFTISDFSGAELLKHFKARVPSLAPVSTVSLAHEMPAAPDVSRAGPKVRGILDTDYVLFVSTIESRKNHAYMFRAWQQLLEKHPREDVPQLIFVGRKGWRVDDLVSAFEDTHFLKGKLTLLKGIGDADLALLYKHASFTCFPSIVEGWGLPIGESLASGTPCVASKTSSMPEVGGDCVDYIDPFDITGGVKLFEDLLYTPGALDRRREMIRERFTPVSWDHVSKEMLSQIDAHVTRLKNEGTKRDASLPATLSPRPMVQFENSLRETDLDAIQDLASIDFSFDERWYWDDRQIKWLIGAEADIEFDPGNDAADCTEDGETAGHGYIPVMMHLTPGHIPDGGTTLQFSDTAGKVIGKTQITHCDLSVTLSLPRPPSGSAASLKIGILGQAVRGHDLKSRPIGIKQFGIGSAIGTPLFTATPVRTPPRRKKD